MTALDSVLSIMAKKDTLYGTSAWDVFKSTLDLYLCAVKLEPHRTDEANTVMRKLLTRVYNEDFLQGNLRYQEIHDFLNPKRQRFIQLLPSGEEGSTIMQTIVTALTMTGGTERDNNWATEIVAAVTAR